MASFFGDLMGGAAKDAATQNTALLTNQYMPAATGALSSAYQTGTNALNQATGYYQPLANLAQNYYGAAPMLANALGLNGPQGGQTALQAFQGANPQFGYGLDLAQQASERAAAAGGGAGTGSGNLIMAEQGNATNLMNQAYQNWINNLQTTGQEGAQLGLNAAGGQAQGQYRLSDLAQNYGSNVSNVYGNVVGGMMNANNQAAQAEQQGASNLLNAGLSIASLGLTPFGTGVLGGGNRGGSGGSYSFANTPFGQLGSSIGNWFGGGSNWAQNNPGAMGSAYYGPQVG
jgi:hypothetical protein